MTIVIKYDKHYHSCYWLLRDKKIAVTQESHKLILDIQKIGKLLEISLYYAFCYIWV